MPSRNRQAKFTDHLFKELIQMMPTHIHTLIRNYIVKERKHLSKFENKENIVKNASNQNNENNRNLILWNASTTAAIRGIKLLLSTKNESSKHNIK